jgi:chromate transporter
MRAGGNRVSEVFWVALRLGLSSFGGPIAHLGYFERTYVRQKQWLTHEQLTGLIALCQILPGPTSSQVGFLIGQRRAGLAGAAAAWLGFTLPSALLMLGCALWAPLIPQAPMAAVLQGLKWLTVMIVAQAVWQMARTLRPDWTRAAIATLSALCVLGIDHTAMPLLVLAAGAVLGAIGARGRAAPAPAAPLRTMNRSRHARTGMVALGVFIALQALLLPTIWLAARPASTPHSLLILTGILYRSGSLVFGGGHVVLPLLHDALVPSGWISDDQFLAGYGAAQALPGPLFSFAAYLGAVIAPRGAAIAWASIALLSLFAPGLLLALAGASLWGWFEHYPRVRAALAGLNAAVVGLLAATLIRPVAISAIHGIADLIIVAAGFLALQRGRIAPVILALSSVALSLALTMLR